MSHSSGRNGGDDRSSPHAPRRAHLNAPADEPLAPHDRWAADEDLGRQPSNLRGVREHSGRDGAAGNAVGPRDTVHGEVSRVPAWLGVEEPSVAGQTRGWLGLLGGLSLVVLTAAATALLVVRMFQPATGSGPETTGNHGYTAASIDSRSATPREVTADRSSPPPPQMVMASTDLRGVDEPLPLGVSLRGAIDGAAVIIHGLPGGTALSAGRPESLNGWRLETADIPNVMVSPPAGFVGTMNLVAELRLADDTVADSRSLRLAWSGPKNTRSAAPTAGPAGDGLATSLPAVRIDREEIDSLIARGENFMSTRDIASARLVLQRAAAAGDARGALGLGETYDPIVLQQRGIRGRVADIATARAWYEKARELGSAEAPRRLQQLAKRGDR